MNNRITVRAVIPHYFAEVTAPVHEIGAGFGSRQAGGRLARSIALSRCLHGLLNLRRSTIDLQLDLRTAVGVGHQHQQTLLNSSLRWWLWFIRTPGCWM